MTTPPSGADPAPLSSVTLDPTDTVTVAVPDTPPAIAVIVAVPLPAAVTRPAALTVATAALLLAQVTEAPAITCPF